MSTPPPSPSTGPGPGYSWPPPSPLPVWGPPVHPREPALNGFALASLLVGLLCLPPLGIVFGVVALVQIANKRERGKALAIVGLAVSVAMTAVLALSAQRFADAVGDRFDAARQFADVEGELVDTEDLHVGDCFNVPGGDLMDDRPLIYKVDCARVHHGEITSAGVFDPTGTPGSAQADRDAEEACWKAQDAYAMDTWALPVDAEMYFYAPTRESWRQGDRRLLCVIGTTVEEHQGSLRRDERTLKPEQVAFLRAANAVEFVISRSPEAEVEDALEEHRAWARKVYAALGDEAKVLQADKARPGLEKAVAAQLREVEAARLAWQRASQARSAQEFDKQADVALGAMSLETEKALRGAYGLSTTVPEWLDHEGDSDDGPWSESV
ncbi:DUF4190 domain-containing protein [Streptomyces sp. NPDC003038]|uniref:DUF4190 domain-containing protein n=1 Tax=unclassified Streptomyces TaxID=2593676 RepID=UPI0033A618CE